MKRVRRKIKNKLSAADSRKRKKEYVDGLERRVEKCTAMNNNLMKKMKLLETENKCAVCVHMFHIINLTLYRSLLEQLRSLQTYVSQFNPSKLQTGSIMMVRVCVCVIVVTMAVSVRVGCDTVLLVTSCSSSVQTSHYAFFFK